eukprot:scaffold97_cov375-Prasinococcus_capsulatus_cf.AAC.6
MKERIEEMRTKLIETETRFEARESREDDLEKIAELENSARQRNAELVKLRAITSKLQRESLNREQTYHKAFGATVNVQTGVVDWMLKSKHRRHDGGRPRHRAGP